MLSLLATPLAYALATPRAPPLRHPSVRLTASTEDDVDLGPPLSATNARQVLTTLQPPATLDGLLAEPCVVFATTTCGYCYQTRQLLDELNVEYTAVELDKIPEGRALRAEVAARTGRTSVPAVFVGGVYAGGANDGGLGGALTLHRKGELTPLLADAGALSAEAAAAAADAAEASTDAADISALVAEKAGEVTAFLFGKLLYRGGTGKKIVWGPFPTDVDPACVPDADERARRRERAAAELTNIDADERQRRLIASGAFGAVTVALAAGLLGFHAPALARVAIGPPLFLTYGYFESYQTGL